MTRYHSKIASPTAHAETVRLDRVVTSATNGIGDTQDRGLTIKD